MAIIALKAWYLEQYEPIREVIKRPHTLRLNKNSLLKSGLRADFLDDIHDVRNSQWFERYLAGEAVEFYIEGSGSYVISNIDLTSQEIYFTKYDVSAWLEPEIYLSYQREYPESSEALQEVLGQLITDLNKKARVPLSLNLSPRSVDEPLRLSSTQLRQIRKSLLFIADVTPVVAIPGENQNELIPSPNVCVEIGYALQSKRASQVLLVQRSREDLSGRFPFDLPNYQQLNFSTPEDLSSTLPTLLESLLRRFNL